VLLGLAPRGAWVLRLHGCFASLEEEGWADEADHQICSSVYGGVQPERKSNMGELLKERICINSETFPPRAVSGHWCGALGGTM
jgi:hypothetical protein